MDDLIRSGLKGGNHCDILGNDGMMEDLLRVVTDFESSHVNENHFVSDIQGIAKINEVAERKEERKNSKAPKEP